jgi:hypothetical protein
MIEEEGFSYILANHEIGRYRGARHWKLECITSITSEQTDANSHPGTKPPGESLRCTSATVGVHPRSAPFGRSKKLAPWP